MNKIVITLIGIVPACLTAVLGYLQGAKTTAEKPPAVQIEGTDEETPKPLTKSWVHRTFRSGTDAAAYLSLPDEQPKPDEVYATLTAGKTLHVWWLPSKSGYKYTYRYITWSSKEPHKVPLPTQNGTQIPIGFATASSRTIFIFFDASK